MATVLGALDGRTPIGSDLKAGVDTISYDQEVTFELYRKVILPLDGYVFWVKAAARLPESSALVNGSPLNTWTPDAPDTKDVIAVPPTVGDSAIVDGSPLDTWTPNDPGVETAADDGTFTTAPTTMVVKGSLHYSTDSTQTEAANYSINRVVFTSENPVDDLNSIGPDELYIAEVDGPPAFQGSLEPAGTTKIRFAFSSRGSYYRQANLWHYVGNAVYSTMASQVVDDPTLLRNELIVSDSIPIWLAFNSYDPPWPVPVPRPHVTIYPSFLVDDNLTPPYVAAHIEPSTTQAVQSMPFLNKWTDDSQLMQETVTFTMYGMSNLMARDFMYSLIQYSMDVGTFGFRNMPGIRDEKEGQNELNTLAQKKKMVFDVSYVSGAVRDVARQLIEKCITTVYPQ